MFYLTTHSTYFILWLYGIGHMVKATQIVIEKTCCHHMGYSFRLAARVLLYASSHRQDNTYHSLCYTSHLALAGTWNRSMGSPHEGSIQRPIAPWANAHTTELHLAPINDWCNDPSHHGVEALIFRDHGIADGNAEKPIWNGIPDFLPKHY